MEWTVAQGGWAQNLCYSLEVNFRGNTVLYQTSSMHEYMKSYILKCHTSIDINDQTIMMVDHWTTEEDSWLLPFESYDNTAPCLCTISCFHSPGRYFILDNKTFHILYICALHGCLRVMEVQRFRGSAVSRRSSRSHSADSSEESSWSSWWLVLSLSQLCVLE